MDVEVRDCPPGEYYVSTLLSSVEVRNSEYVYKPYFHFGLSGYSMAFDQLGRLVIFDPASKMVRTFDVSSTEKLAGAPFSKWGEKKLDYSGDLPGEFLLLADESGYYLVGYGGAHAFQPDGKLRWTAPIGYTLPFGLLGGTSLYLIDDPGGANPTILGMYDKMTSTRLGRYIFNRYYNIPALEGAYEQLYLKAATLANGYLYLLSDNGSFSDNNMFRVPLAPSGAYDPLFKVKSSYGAFAVLNRPDSGEEFYFSDTTSIKRVARSGDSWVAKTIIGTDSATVNPVDGIGTDAVFVDIRRVLAAPSGDLWVNDAGYLRRVCSCP